MNINPTHEPAIVKDNETAVARSLAEGNYVQAYLLVHALTESLLRGVLDQSDRSSFNDLIRAYELFLQHNHYPTPEFVDELTQFNRRRNRMVHELFRKGFTATNNQAKQAATTAVMMYGLLIEWFATFDDSIAAKGFELTKEPSS